MRLFFILGVTLALCASLRADEQQPGHNTLTEKEQTPGWVLLFDGKSTDGWEISIEAMGLRGSEEKQADVWSAVAVRYTGGLEINGELKEPGFGTKKMQCFLFKDLGVSHPTRFTVREDTKLSLRNIKIRKL